MAIAIVGLGLALTAFALQWYMGKKADDEEARSQVHHQHHPVHAAKR